MKRLLVVYHTQTGHTEAMARAVVRGARHPEVAGVEVRLRRAIEAGLDDLLEADAVAFGTPENFGQLSGGMKDFLDRTYYPAQGRIEGLPYAVFISAGNDGRGGARGASQNRSRISVARGARSDHRPRRGRCGRSR